MKIQPYKDISSLDWNQFALTSPEAWMFHYYEWIKLEESYFFKNNHSFAVLDDNDSILAICPLYQVDLGRGSWVEKILCSGYHRHAGPAIIDVFKDMTKKNVFSFLMKHIFYLGKSLKVDRLFLSSHNLAPVNCFSKKNNLPLWVLMSGFHYGLNFSPMGDFAVPGGATVCADQIVDLELSEEELFVNLKSSFQRAVRKANRSDLVFTSLLDSPVEDFFKIAKLSAKRTGEKLGPISYYQEIQELFSSSRKCKYVFVMHNGIPIASSLLLIDKNGANFLAGVSVPEFLSLRVNNFLHWETIKYLKNNGITKYRLGPIFPELPEHWPICRVSKFKGTLGGESTPICHGSYFLHPEKYEADSHKAFVNACETYKSDELKEKTKQAKQFKIDLANILKSYGFFIPNCASGDAKNIFIFKHKINNRMLIEISNASLPGITPELEVVHHDSGEILFTCGEKPDHRKNRKSFQTVLPFISFSGDHITPLWQTEKKCTVVAWYQHEEVTSLIFGLDIVEEIIKCRQGDINTIDTHQGKVKWGFNFERSNYLFDLQSLDEPYTPQVDVLGYWLAETLAIYTGYLLLEPLPHSIKGLVILTGDDDQAYLEKYKQQLEALGELPITYLLVHQTKHTPETLAQMAKTVEFGLHPDALDDPGNYDELCHTQYKYVQGLTESEIRIVRNHGYLNHGYWGHMDAWERDGLILDVNLAGVDGTAINGSFLPMRFRRNEGSWSDHYSLLTAFGDGMIFALGMSERQAIKKIKDTAKKIEKTRPGVLVFNLHPQNIDKTRKIHKFLVKLASRRGWKAMGLNSYLDWILALQSISVSKNGSNFLLHSTDEIEGLVLKYWQNDKWVHKVIPPFIGEIEVGLS